MIFPAGADHLVEAHLIRLLTEVEKEMQADCLFYSGPIAFGADDVIRDAVEKFSKRKKKLVFMLETPGGFAEQARRISDTLRHHYQEVDFLIPSHAMSAGTILVLSGDAIWMDYYSVLGPIDPQVPRKDERERVPALGYLIQYDELIQKANDGKANAAELQILLSFDQGELYSYKQSLELSLTLLKEWLVKYKFKDWKVTEGERRKVTMSMKKQRASEIAEKLSNIQVWNSHGIGISMTTLQEKLKLRIDDFGEKEELRTAVRSYHTLVSDYMGKKALDSIVQTRDIFTGRSFR